MYRFLDHTPVEALDSTHSLMRELRNGLELRHIVEQLGSRDRPGNLLDGAQLVGALPLDELMEILKE